MVIARQPFCWKWISVTKVSKYGKSEYSRALDASYTFQPVMSFWYPVNDSYMIVLGHLKLIQNLDLVCWKTVTFVPECRQGNVRVDVLKWSHWNSGKKTNWGNKINYSFRSSFLHVFCHHTFGWGRTTYHALFGKCKSTSRLVKSTLVNIRANFQSHARQRSSSQGSSFTNVSLTHGAEKTQRLKRAYILTATLSKWNKFAYEEMNVYSLAADGDCHWKRICHYALATKTNRVMMLAVLWKKMLLKSARNFNSVPWLSTHLSGF